MSTPAHLIVQPTSPPAAAVVWLHGYGDEPESWASELSSLRTQNAASVKWVFLRAERRPQAYAGGVAIPSWGDWREDAMTKVGSKDYDNEQILAASVRTDLGSILTSIVQVDRVPPTRIIVGGFSMGATVAAEAALQWCSRAEASAKLGGLVMLNGWLLPGARRAIGDGAANGLSRVLVCHGTADEQVGYDCGEEAARRLSEGGANTTFKSFPGDHVSTGFGPCKIAAHEFIEAFLGAASNAAKRRRKGS